ncbi:MAG: OsmC family protein [Bdellovibrio sp.]|nr:OsmC family protein [Bdellovibrio sp.]
MKLKAVWGEKMRFAAEADNHTVAMDTKPPIGDDSALTPKQLLVAAICGCTGMDVVALLKKYHQPLSKFEIEAEASVIEGIHPVIFKEVQLTFKIEGELDQVKVLEAITLSQTKYCSVSAMLSKSFPIKYTVQLNLETIGAGSAQF